MIKIHPIKLISNQIDIQSINYILLCVEAFDSVNALDKLEGFASFFGADFYGIPRNTVTIKLRKQSWQVPQSYPFGLSTVVPLRATETIQWTYVRDS